MFPLVFAIIRLLVGAERFSGQHCLDKDLRSFFALYSQYTF